MFDWQVIPGSKEKYVVMISLPIRPYIMPSMRCTVAKTENTVPWHKKMFECIFG